MQNLQKWIATIVTGALLVLFVILELTSDHSRFKAFVWIVLVLLLAGGVTFDLYRQKKISLPS